MRTELTVYADTFAAQDHPTLNYGTNDRLRLRSTASGKGKLTYLYPTMPFWPGQGARVFEAKLRLVAANNWNGEHTITARRITQQWAEGKLNWNNRPSVSNANAATVTVEDLTEGDAIEIDLTAIAADVAAGAAYYGIRLEVDSDVNGAVRVWSAEAAAQRKRPVVEVEWRNALEAPIPLAPIGGAAVSLEGPTLVWRNNWGDGVQIASQVQVSTSEDFSSPAYDSGEKTNSETQWSLEGEYSVPDSATRWWRVRTKDDTGQWSEWSDPQSFTRVSKGELVIVSPVPAPGEEVAVVEETTPPIAAQLSGATLRLWAYELYIWWPPSGLWALGLPGSWRDDPVIRWTPPPGIIRSGYTYKVRFRALDDADRAATPGDPAEYVAEVAFRYERPSSVIAPVESLDVVTNGPRARLTWTRSQTPDEWCIRIDGREVIQAIDPEDVRVDATTWSMDVWVLRPGVPQQVEVEAVVRDDDQLIHSGGNPTKEVRIRPEAAWLVDPTDGTAVKILQTDGRPDELDRRLHEASERHETLAGSVIQVTDGIGGYVGSVAGQVRTQAQLQTLLELRRRDTDLRLIAAEMNIPVRIHSVSEPPANLPGNQMWDVRFEFFQTGEIEELFEGPVQAPDEPLYLSDHLYLSDDTYLS